MKSGSSIRFAVYFGAITVAAIIGAVVASHLLTRIVLAWVALAAITVAAAYVSGSPQLFFKRPDGSRPVGSWLLLWPYFAMSYFSLGLYRLLHRRHPACAEVSGGLWFSRRLTKTEAESSGVRWAAVIDLAAEFARAQIPAERYFSVPMLDGAAPAEEQLRHAIELINEQLAHGPVIVHCALGHGRTGTVIISWMLEQGLVPDVQTGIKKLRSLRPGFGLSSAQADFIEREFKPEKSGR